MGSEFVDRAKMEAEADEQYPTPHPDAAGPLHQECFCDECCEMDGKHRAFLAGAAAYAALLDAETFTERKHEWRSEGGVTRLIAVERQTASSPWLPSEGGEKP